MGPDGGDVDVVACVAGRTCYKPEVDLKVFYGRDIPSGKPEPLSFDDPEVSRLRESLLDNFEDQAKIFRIFCIDDTELLALAKDQVKRYLN